jgi:hypothetical protein
MSTDFEQDDLPKILARALVRAWELYRAFGNGTLSAEVVRPSLARHLVSLAEEGMTREGPLAAAGFRYLVSLAAAPPSSKTSPPKEDSGAIFEAATRQLLHFRIDHAHARFLLQWRIPWGIATSARISGSAHAERAR